MEKRAYLPDIITLCDIADMCGLTLQGFVEIKDDDSFPSMELSEKEWFLIEKYRATQPNIQTAIEVLLGTKN